MSISTLMPTVWYDESAKTSPAQEAGRLLFWAIIACLCTIINRFAGYWVPLPSYGTFLGHLFALLYLALLLLALLQTARHAARLPFSTGILLLCGVLLALPMGAVLLMQQNHVFPTPILSLTANNLFLPVAAAMVGAGVGRIIRHPNTLLAAAGFSLFFDIVVVTMGTVAQLMKTGNSGIIAAVSVGAGSSAVSSAVLPSMKAVDPISGVTIGPADVLFLALFQAAVHQMNLSRRATFAWMFTLLFAALVIVELFSLPVPALAPMGIAVLIANLRHAAFTEREKRDLFIGGAFAVFCASLIILVPRLLIKPDLPAKHLGFTVGPVSPREFYIGATEGRSNIEAGSMGDKAGLIAGDQVLAINRMSIPRLLQEGRLYPILEEAPRTGMILTVRLRDTNNVITVYLPPGDPVKDKPVTAPPASVPRRARPESSATPPADKPTAVPSPAPSSPPK